MPRGFPGMARTPSCSPLSCCNSARPKHSVPEGGERRAEIRIAVDGLTVGKKARAKLNRRILLCKTGRLARRASAAHPRQHPRAYATPGLYGPAAFWRFIIVFNDEAFHFPHFQMRFRKNARTNMRTPQYIK